MKYAKISAVDKKRLVECFQIGGDYQFLARQMNIKKTTAYEIVRRGTAENGAIELPRGGLRYKKMDAELENKITEIVDGHPEFTLQQINAQLRILLPNKPRVSSSTLARSLAGQLITMKTLIDCPAERNSPETKAKRRDYAHWMLQIAVHQEQIFIDETGFNLWLRRSRGRSRRGQRAVRVVGHRRGNNLSIIFAVSNVRGLLHHDIIEGGMNAERFVSFLQHISNNVEFQGQSVCIFDNAPAHRRAAAANIQENLSVKWLPPYSPFLNIVENVISIWKAKLRVLLAEVKEAMLIMPYAEKVALLLHLAEQAVDVITPQKVLDFHRHMHQFLPLCILENDIL